MERLPPHGLVLRLAEDRDLDDVAGLLRAADDSRVLSAESLRYWHRRRLERARIVDVVAELDDEVVGAGGAGLDTGTSADGAGWAFLTVGRDHRRRGIGDALGSRLLEHLRSIGASRATSFIRGVEESEHWALARGWARVFTGPLIALDPRRVPESPPPPGFRCVAMSSVAPQAAYEAKREALLDEPWPVPNDDFRFDQFLREWQDPDLDLDASRAVVDEAGRVAAFAFMKLVGTRGQHGFTGTVRKHRGRGLATAAKRDALRAAAAQGVTLVTTSNADENAAMRAINHRLGFEPIGEHVIIGRDV
jgi:RimJ/RimL family protein N-acetyltransferase